jgi:anti-sigma B factor antagonist
MLHERLTRERRVPSPTREHSTASAAVRQWAAPSGAAPVETIGNLVVSGDRPSRVITVIGDLSQASAAALADAGSILLEDGATEVTIDLSQVTFIDSSGLGALIAIRKAAATSSASVFLAAVPQPVIRVLQISGLLAVFAIDAADPDAA